MGTLYLVATPIGNLEDMTLRGIRVLSEAGTIATEDTRTTRRLLDHFQIRASLLSYTEHNRRSRIPQILSLLEQQDVALVSEAGMPAISDPGYDLVVAAAAAGHTVTAIPGASAILAALVVSGISARRFLFLGFLPRKQGERRTLLQSVADYQWTLVCFEAPSRLHASLADLLACLGDRRIAICRELTKLHEEIVRTTISEALTRTRAPRGEYTLVVEGAAPVAAETISGAMQRRLVQLKQSGLSARDASAALAAEFHVSRRRAYDAWLALEQ